MATYCYRLYSTVWKTRNSGIKYLEYMEDIYFSFHVYPKKCLALKQNWLKLVFRYEEHFSNIQI